MADGQTKCLLPGCESEGQSHFSGFCSHDHRKSGYALARRRGLELLRKEVGETVHTAPLPRNDQKRAKSHREAILLMLRSCADEWLDHPYDRLRVMWHSRIPELRAQGHRILCRVVIDSEGRRDYQYRLTEKNA